MNNFRTFDYVDNLKYSGCGDNEVRLGYRAIISEEQKHVIFFIRATLIGGDKSTSSYRMYIPFKNMESKEDYYRLVKETLIACKYVMESVGVNPNTERKRNMSIYMLDTVLEDYEPLFLLLQKTEMGNEVNRLLNTYYRIDKDIKGGK